MLRVLRERQETEGHRLPLLELLTEPKKEKENINVSSFSEVLFAQILSGAVFICSRLGYIFISLFGDYEAVYCVRG